MIFVPDIFRGYLNAESGRRAYTACLTYFLVIKTRMPSMSAPVADVGCRPERPAKSQGTLHDQAERFTRNVRSWTDCDR